MKIFIRKILIFSLFFAQNIDCGYTLGVLMSTYNLCFGAKIIKIGIPLHTPVLIHKVGLEGVYITRTCFHDETVSRGKYDYYLSSNGLK